MVNISDAVLLFLSVVNLLVLCCVKCSKTNQCLHFIYVVLANDFLCQ